MLMSFYHDNIQSFTKRVLLNCSQSVSVSLPTLPAFITLINHFFWAAAWAATTFALSLSTTDGSNRVDVSPKVSSSPAAILRKIRRMILPLLVMGKATVGMIISGVAKGPIEVLTAFRNSLINSSLSVYPSVSVVKQQMPCPLISCGRPTTAAWATAGCATSALSTSACKGCNECK